MERHFLIMPPDTYTFRSGKLRKPEIEGQYVYYLNTSPLLNYYSVLVFRYSGESSTPLEDNSQTSIESKVLLNLLDC